MSRRQWFEGDGIVTLAVADTPQQLSASTEQVKSALVQAHPDNLGRVTVQDATGAVLCILDAGRGATFKGDEMDNGGSGQFLPSELYAESTAAGDKVILSVTRGV